jgi:hypothetical protein
MAACRPCHSLQFLHQEKLGNKNILLEFSKANTSISLFLEINKSMACVSFTHFIGFCKNE